MAFLFRFCLVAAHFLCPLIFFTNLTRNPYIVQICLLNICLAAAAAIYFLRGCLKGETLRFARTPLDAPWLAMLAACALSWIVAYWGHAPFFRPAMASEGLRAAWFVIVNAFVPFYLAAAIPWSSNEKEEPSVGLGWWAAFTIIWGFLWLGYPQMRVPASVSAHIWLAAWDPYAAFLWVIGLAAVLWLCRRGRIMDFLHLALAAAFLASVYGVCQYFNYEIIWPKTLNPYGGRSVSTFGNPNFLSSYNVMLLPVAVVCFIEARSFASRLAYGLVALALEAALLCTMTRSSWAAALAAVSLLGLSPELRRSVSRQAKPCGLLAGAALAVVLLWPASSISTSYTPSVISRLTEIGESVKTKGTYSPFHQRVLIWCCAWQMGAENPLTGKGWGLLELFYPFYQGPLLNALDWCRTLRTHANNAHNEVLEIWAQTGLLGLGILFWMWTSFAAAASRWSRSLRLPLLWRAGVAGVAGMLIDNMLNVSLHFSMPGFLFWWLAGMTMSAALSNSWRTAPKAAAAKALAAAVVLLSCAASWYYIRVWNRETYYFTGFKFIREGALPGAIKELESSRAWGPREVNAIYELGNAYARSERFIEADRAYAQALQANAGYDEIYFNIGVLKSLRLGQMQSAIDYFRTALWINPLSPEVYNSLSAIYLRDPSRYAAAASRLLERATHFFPDNPNYWHNLGYLNALGKRWPQAVAAYSRALAMAPDMAVAQNGLAAALAQSGLPRPPIAEGLARLRELDARLGRGDYSEASLELALSLAQKFPQMQKARFLAGTLLLVRGRPREAAAHLEWVVARSPKNVSALSNLAQAYMSLGRTQDARAKFLETLALDPGNAAANAGLRALGLQ